MSQSIDLNADLGEGFPWDHELLRLVTSANLCCGAHAGDDQIILRTLEAARAADVVIGGHPGYPDRPHFGRIPKAMSPDQVCSLIEEQVEHLASLAREVGLSLRYLKPHGALYNQARDEPSIAEGVVDAAARLGLPLLGLDASLVKDLCLQRSMPYFVEGFPDRASTPDGRLLPRSVPGAVLHDPDIVAAQALTLARRGRHSLCIHGDQDGCVELARRVADALRAEGLEIRSFLTQPQSRAE